MSRAATRTRDDPAGAPAASTISVRDLGMTRTRPSGEQVPAFEGLTFDVARGEFVSLIGPSGSGKTSTLGVIAGLERPTQGEVLVDGRPVTGPGPDRAVLFQEPALFPWLSVRGNMDLALRLANIPPDERPERAGTWLARVEADRAADRQPHELSAGMRQRVALARATRSPASGSRTACSASASSAPGAPRSSSPPTTSGKRSSSRTACS